MPSVEQKIQNYINFTKTTTSAYVTDHGGRYEKKEEKKDSNNYPPAYVTDGGNRNTNDTKKVEKKSTNNEPPALVTDGGSKKNFAGSTKDEVASIFKNSNHELKDKPLK